MSVRLEVPLPVTPAPLSPAEAFSVPSPTARVTVMEPEAASMSAMERPVPFSERLEDCSAL